MMSLHQSLSPSARVAVERAQAAGNRSAGIVQRAAFGVGGGCLPARNPPPGSTGTYCPPPSVEVPGCGTRVPICDMKKIGAQKVVAGGAPFFIDIEPTKTPFFDPRAIRVTAVDLGNADTAHRVMFTAVTINGFPQEGVNNTAPTLPAAVGDELEGWWSDDYTAPEEYAVKVQWGYISNDSNTLVLRLHGIAVGYTGATSILLGVTLYGNPLQSLPASIGAEMACQPRCNHPQQ